MIMLHTSSDKITESVKTFTINKQSNNPQNQLAHSLFTHRKRITHGESQKINRSCNGTHPNFSESQITQ